MFVAEIRAEFYSAPQNGVGTLTQSMLVFDTAIDVQYVVEEIKLSRYLIIRIRMKCEPPVKIDSADHTVLI